MPSWQAASRGAYVDGRDRPAGSGSAGPGFQAGCAPAQAACDFREAVRIDLGGAALKRRKLDITQIPANVGKGVDDRFQAATPLRGLRNKVFPDHWSFLLGEIALFSFIIL